MSLPGMSTSIAYLLASIGGIVATWYIFKKVVPWIQAYRDQQEQADLTQGRQDAQQENQQANSDSDALDKKEREHG